MIGRPSWRLPRCGRCPMRECRIAEEPPCGTPRLEPMPCLSMRSRTGRSATEWC